MIVLLSDKLLLNILIHSLSGDTDKIDVEIKSELWFESDVDCLLTSSIDDSFWSVEMEIVCKSLGQLAQIRGRVFSFLTTLFLTFGGHFELYEDIAITPIVYSCLHGFIESNSDGSKVNIWWLDLDSSITPFSEYFESILLNELGLLCHFLSLNSIIFV